MNIVPEFSDNILVQRNRWGNEYLAISLRPATKHKDYRVYIYRYCVPGRCDTYSFQWKIGQSLEPANVRYFSDSHLPLSKALSLVESDFNRPRVVEMCVNAFNAERIVLHYRHDFLKLLGVIAPKSKAYRAVKKLCKKTMEERAVRLEGERGKKLLASIE